MSDVFTSLKLENFRSFPRLDISDCRSINIVTGRNGSGKTAILEAVYINSEAGNFHSLLALNGIRGETLTEYSNDRAFRSFFNDLGVTKSASITAHWKAEKKDTTAAKRDLTLRPIRSMAKSPGYPEAQQIITGIEMDFQGSGFKGVVRGQWLEEAINLFPGQNPSQKPVASPGVPTTFRFHQDPPQPRANVRVAFMSPAPREATNFIYQHLVTATRQKNIGPIVELASIVDPRAVNFVPLFESGTNQVYVDIGGTRLTPLTMMGAGFANILQIAVGIVQTGSQVILIDEIEDGLHYTTFPKIARAIIGLARDSNLQFFLSTHSAEFLDAFVVISRELKFDDVCAFRVADRAGERLATRFEFDDLDNATSIDLDVR